MLILKNARIVDVCSPNHYDSVIVIEGKKVLAVGGEDLVGQHAGKATIQDMHGHTILPGLTDAHIHLYQYALSRQRVDVETPTKAEALDRVRQAAKAAKKGEWILGHGFQHNLWDGQLPSRYDLDVVSPNNPVYLTGKSLHLGWANSYALRLAGIDRLTPDPINGKVVKDANNDPTGILLELAMELVDSQIPKVDAERAALQIEEAIPSLWKLGITSVHDFDYQEALDGLNLLESENRLKLKVVKNIPVQLLPIAVQRGYKTGQGSGNIRIGSVKVFMDGALGARTAAMIAPYENDGKNVGILNMDWEGFLDIALESARAGLGITGHAIGDMAVRQILEGFRHLRQFETENNLPKMRHRIEHVQLVHPEDAAKLAELDIVASMQPIHAISDMEIADKHWGARINGAYAWQSQLNHGAILAFGSDSPVESPNPFWGLYAATQRKKLDHPNSQNWIEKECLTIQDAIAAYTVGPAYAAYQERELGQLKPGYSADLIVLEQDPYQANAQELRDMLPIATMIDGQWVYQKESASI